MAAGQVEGGHGGGAELLQQPLQECGGLHNAAAQPVVLLQGGQGLSLRAEEAVGDIRDGVESHTCGDKQTQQKLQLVLSPSDIGIRYRQVERKKKI